MRGGPLIVSKHSRLAPRRADEEHRCPDNQGKLDLFLNAGGVRPALVSPTAYDNNPVAVVLRNHQLTEEGQRRFARLPSLRWDNPGSKRQ